MDSLDAISRSAMTKHRGRLRAVVGAALCCIACSGLTVAQEAVSSAAAESAWTIPANDDIRKLLAQRMQHNGMGIVVGIIEPAGQRVIVHGKRSANDSHPLDGDTVFQIGSVTKTFTTLLLADMVQRGEVALDDPASKYLPADVRMPQRGRPTTLRDLATHMSGLPSMPTNYDLQGQPDPFEAYSVRQLHEFLSSYQAAREAGVKFEYSNLGVALLGRLLAARAGMDYERLLTRRVLQPLNMQSTSITLSAHQTRRLAPGHDRYLQPVRTWEMATLPASGSLRSTANDMLNYLAAYLGYTETPLKAAMSYQLSERLPVNTGFQALGWGMRNASGREIVGHDGGKQGYRTGIMFDLKARTGVIVLANARTDDTPISIANHLLTGRPLSPAPAAPAARKLVELSPETLKSYAGRYRLSAEIVLTAAPKDKHLIVDMTGGGPSEFIADGPHSFFLNTGNDEMEFQIGADGRVTGLVLYGSGRAAGESKLAPRVER